MNNTPEPTPPGPVTFDPVAVTPTEERTAIVAMGAFVAAVIIAALARTHNKATDIEAHVEPEKVTPPAVLPPAPAQSPEASPEPPVVDAKDV